MITRLLFGEPFPWEAEPLPLCEPLPWELEPLPPCESFASEPELSQTLSFCVTVREPDSKIFVTDLQPAFAGATKEVNTAAAAAIVSPIFLMTLSSENVLRSPAGKITQSCRHHCETGHTGPRFVDHHGHVVMSTRHTASWPAATFAGRHSRSVLRRGDAGWCNRLSLLRPTRCLGFEKLICKGLRKTANLATVRPQQPSSRGARW